jgi:hypothetical protein
VAPVLAVICVAPVRPFCMLTWVKPEHSTTGTTCIRTRLIKTERLVAAGIDGKKNELTAWNARRLLSKQVRRQERKLERNADEDATRKQAEARRKRMRRVVFDNEDRNALRKLARSCNDGTQLELEPTPEGLRETAKDGTPRSAKAAGAKLRKLTNTFYSRLTG